MSALRIKQVSFAYLDGLVLQDIDLSIEAGERVALVGPNGSGKTTLIKLASGILKPAQGEVHLDGHSLARLPRRAVAQRVAVVPQQFYMPFAFTVGEVVLLGRTPFLKAFSEEGERDHWVIHWAMQLTGVSDFEHRPFNELSGGERQRVILAMALAQEPRLLLLDEPTAHLDINHQVEILGVVKGLNKEQGLTVVGAMHDLNLAALYFDRLVMLRDGRVFADGPPGQVLTEENIREVFRAPVQVYPHPSLPVPHIVILPRE